MRTVEYPLPIVSSIIFAGLPYLTETTNKQEIPSQSASVYII